MNKNKKEKEKKKKTSQHNKAKFMQFNELINILIYIELDLFVIIITKIE